MGHEGDRRGLMTMVNPNDRSDLTPDELDLAGRPGDLVTETVVPPRKPRATVLVSLRMDRSTFDGIGRLSERRGATFSDVARDALRTYVVAHSGSGTYPEAEHRDAHRRASEVRRHTWDDSGLRTALEDYEAACRAAAMQENAWRSYVDYARRFIAWREGAYHPRGEAEGGRPVPHGSATSDDLRSQARVYAKRIEQAGRAQPTIDTYFRHAMFFIRWLEGEFEPGRRLRGL